MTKYRKKPIVVEAIQFTGFLCVPNIKKFVNDGSLKVTDLVNSNVPRIEIETLEGNMLVNEGDYIIKGVDGEFYPCKAEIFEKTYERLW